ncbi:CvfD/Ygs/GSP13 family RNA-binding post-transcriptional regulator [Lactobacillus sp.]|uniref:CvfD/Ygs/GSP13 family RNA-binding post-transcriptional regulator n=1 Tax=Lactobacillus sp. TaxID=1591 RepID=UPI0019B135B2|nr:CvfD/Ygs/GSP13 family RNA-binding post-transcriptional regulator [Lactobacillus sp.]MBD5429948.1 S1 RNA-binding domain-containing protein [Lactobacillus sp.]
MALKIGDIVEGKINGIQQYGIFVKLNSEKEGLVHISEVHGGYVEDIGHEFKVGEKIKVMILDIDPYNGQISLSHRAVLPPVKEARKKHLHFWTSKRAKLGFEICEDELKKQINNFFTKKVD